MIQKNYLKFLLIICLYLLSIGGWLMHYRIHPPAVNVSNYVPFLTGLVSIFIIPTMFFRKELVSYAYVLNGITVIIGTITMVHYSLTELPSPLTISAVLLNTTFPVIVLLWTKVFLGKAIFDLELTNTNNLDTPRHHGRFWRYPNMGFWWVHLISLSLVYYLGHTWWR